MISLSGKKNLKVTKENKCFQNIKCNIIFFLKEWFELTQVHRTHYEVIQADLRLKGALSQFLIVTYGRLFLYLKKKKKFFLLCFYLLVQRFAILVFETISLCCSGCIRWCVPPSLPLVFCSCFTVDSFMSPGTVLDKCSAAEPPLALFLHFYYETRSYYTDQAGLEFSPQFRLALNLH